MFKKFDHLTIYALALTLLSILAVVFFHTGKADALDDERRLMAQQKEAKEISFAITTASDYLTMETRKFAITLNPVHLRNYWREVNVIKRRDAAMKRLEQMNVRKEEYDLLNQAKNNSDALVNTETQSQRLVLEVYEVPEDQMEPMVRDYQLTQEDRELDFNKKINKAREILYDEKYDLDKERIQAPIRKFQETIDKRLSDEVEAARDRVDRYSMLSSSWMVLLTLLIFLFVYNMIQRIGTPLKDFEAQLKRGEGRVELSSQSMVVIRNIADKVNGLMGYPPTEREKEKQTQKPSDEAISDD